MRLKELLADKIFKQSIRPEILSWEIHSIFNDSRQVKPRSLFVAEKGFKTDGIHFIKDAFQGHAYIGGARVKRDAML